MTGTRGQNLAAAARRFNQNSAAKPHKASVLCLLVPALCYLPSAFAIDATRPVYTPPPPAVSSSSIVQVIFSLLLVLAAIVLVAWALKRINTGRQGVGNHIKVLSGIAIGQRERVVLVEIKDTWLVLGVGPGQIRTLHTMPKQDADDMDNNSTSSRPGGNPNKFAAMLSSALNSISPAKHDAP